MSEKQKSYAKWTVVLLALLCGGAGVDAAGYDPTALDTTSLEKLVAFLSKLGAATAVALIVYLHRYWFPLVTQGSADLRVLVERSDAAETRRMARELAETGRLAEAEEAAPVAVTANATPRSLRVLKDTP